MKKNQERLAITMVCHFKVIRIGTIFETGYMSNFKKINSLILCTFTEKSHCHQWHLLPDKFALNCILRIDNLRIAT